MDQWYVARGKEKTGPFSFAQLGSLVGNGVLRATDMVLQEGTRKWMTAQEVPGLFAPPATPAIPTQVAHSAAPAAIPVPAATVATVRMGFRRQHLWVGGGIIALAACVLAAFLLFRGKRAPSDDAALKADVQEVERLLARGKGTASFFVERAPKRFEAWREAAEAGSPEGQYLHARCYAVGAGVSEDPQKMMLWLRKSADQGFALAQTALGACYHEGLGVPKDRTEVIGWLRKAADQGDPAAQSSLGLCYLH